MRTTRILALAFAGAEGLFGEGFEAQIDEDASTPAGQAADRM
ncbi:MAG: hypothetical protein SGJ13_08560 [Actinomycetota bacterium]|nr:hypothetical protein [Actinomycetota bacterium]